MATRRCTDCKTDISSRGSSAVRCIPCQAARHKARKNELNRSPYKKVGTSARHVIGVGGRP